jgi:hypothetical protein
MAESKLEQEMIRIATLFNDAQSKCRVNGNWVVQKADADKYNDLCLAIVPYQGSMQETKELADLVAITGKILMVIATNLNKSEFAQLRELMEKTLTPET